MNCKFYRKAKLTQIILDLIYLYDEMRNDGNTDNRTLQELKQTIDNLKYYLQFLND